MAIYSLTDPVSGDTIDFRECHPGSPREQWSQDNQRITVQYFVPWDDRHKAKTALLGINKLDVDNGIRYIRRELPHRYPKVNPPGYLGEQSDNWQLYAKSIIDVEGIAPYGSHDSDGVAEFDDAKLTVLYEWPRYSVFDDGSCNDPDYGAPSDIVNGVPSRFIRRKLRPYTQILNSRAAIWMWLDGPNVGGAIGFELPYKLSRVSISYFQYSVPLSTVPLLTIARAGSGVNNATFDGFPTGTLQFMEAGMSDPKLGADGSTELVDMEFRFVAYTANDSSGALASHTANHFPDPADFNRFHEIGRDAGGGTTVRPFQSFSVPALFRPKTA